MSRDLSDNTLTVIPAWVGNMSSLLSLYVNEGGAFAKFQVCSCHILAQPDSCESKSNSGSKSLFVSVPSVSFGSTYSECHCDLTMTCPRGVALTQSSRAAPLLRVKSQSHSQNRSRLSPKTPPHTRRFDRRREFDLDSQKGIGRVFLVESSDCRTTFVAPIKHFALKRGFALILIISDILPGQAPTIICVKG